MYNDCFKVREKMRDEKKDWGMIIAPWKCHFYEFCSGENSVSLNTKFNEQVKSPTQMTLVTDLQKKCEWEKKFSIGDKSANKIFFALSFSLFVCMKKKNIFIISQFLVRLIRNLIKSFAYFYNHKFFA